ncbi:MAG TPA: peptide chain release factor N(5)-glutamine methyltransferase [Candidatus Sulfotelmatobacter sp.]|nr:peptide chain release factor N(5)-glutamine methyltransferase [Candidatus Sulfotelmatobacter sp.]
MASAVARLTEENVPSPRMNAELLLKFILDCDRAYLFAHPERELSQEEEARYESALVERSRGVPAQYIAGHQEFWGMDLIVTPAVLIPRPETEHLLETALELVTSDLRPRTSDLSQKVLASGIRIVDVGTGSGCIALALAKELPGAEIHATDTSASALEIARANAARLQLENRIHFAEADLLGDLRGPFDIIVSNPPYVGESETDQVQLEVRNFEPRTAVFAGSAGTEVIARLIPQARAALRPGGWLLLEISGTIVDDVRRLLQGWEGVEVTADLQSIPRVVRAQKPKA